MEWIAGQISVELNQQIFDETGLQGVFDFELTYTPEVLRNHSSDRFRRIDPTGPSIFDAVGQQLGLRLEERTGTALVVVVDRIEPPILE